MHTPAPYSRRTFIQSSALLAGAFAIGSALGQSPNGDVRLAIVGIRSRGMQLARDAHRTKGCVIVAICDADTAILEKRAAEIESELGVTPEKVSNYRKLLERPDIDAVVLATPNHLHAIQTIWACQAGKDVYVEKPVCHNVWEGQQMVAAARAHNRIVQPGLQNRSDVGLKEAFAWIKQGNIGKIKQVRGLCYRNRASIGKSDTPIKPPSTLDYDEWLGPAADLPMYRERVHYDWHWVWNTGNGDFGNQGPHELDLMRWILDDPDHPKAIESYGGRFAWGDGGETPNMQITKLDWGTVPAYFEVRNLWVTPETNAAPNFKGYRVGVVVTCEGGEFRGGRGGGIVYHEGNKKGERFQGKGGFDHFPSFIRAINSRKESDLACTLETGYKSACLSHFRNISIQVGKEAATRKTTQAMSRDSQLKEAYDRFSEQLDAWKIDRSTDRWTIGRRLKIDTAKERFVGSGSGPANKLIKREDRKGSEVPKYA
ncbi:Gfo/Idh/MocA family oxidoreductase [Pelagicoccus enzymogenes]|uniref:Gfo/Idh/MocA family protein n=1 Tax=Pelagicoccus enzymogenes TaxID=2773457 RepID=UPI0028104959|nr:Gfo/Idh/MocA family oxidoreductase [Pelagicoccus enzymogenes]MDQ8196637.1 Gfo/Idh/MocA family oxidoreductase [Pelagicoccus enzymogenes]